MRSNWLWLAAAGALAASAAYAQEAKVEVSADVVWASNKGNAIEPPSLAKMKDEFAKQNLRFTSFKLLESKQVVLTQSQASELSLPNGATAKLRLSELKDGQATVAVELRKVESKIVLGKKNAVFVHGGKHADGELVLVLQPSSEITPRKTPPPMRELLKPRMPFPKPQPEPVPPPVQ